MTTEEDDKPRLIERAFPLEQTSIDSVHEKNVRHGHISTLHIWPARRPLAACRAALIATLLPDPGNPEARKKLCDRIGGKVVEVVKKKKVAGKTIEEIKRETEGGILHWGRESAPDLDWFKKEIRKAYGGQAPRVMDPFAGGGAIPLEAMRLGCQATAIDINPVAWCILKATLEYPQRLSGKKHPLPAFIVQDQEFMRAYFESLGFTGGSIDKQLSRVGIGKAKEGYLKGMDPEVPDLEGDLAWHVRAWGKWVAEKAKRTLANYYPVIDGKPTVAYLWARAVNCKNCGAAIPLLKTLWLCRKDAKKVVLTMDARKDGKGVRFGIKTITKGTGGNDSQRRENEKRLGAGTMNRKGAWCPGCGKQGTVAMSMEDIRQEGMAGRLGVVMTAVICEGADGKEYRLPTKEELEQASHSSGALSKLAKELPFGLPSEPINTGSVRKGGVSVTRWGFTMWKDLFSPRQLLALGTFVLATREAATQIAKQKYPADFSEAIPVYLAMAIDKLVDYIASLCTWHITGEKMSHVFVRFALPITWDFAELNPLSSSSGNYLGCLDWVARVVDNNLVAGASAPPPEVLLASATSQTSIKTPLDVIITDPPYYDAIPYADLTDIFYVWLRRTLFGLPGNRFDTNLSSSVIAKWDHVSQDGELIDDESRFGGDSRKAKDAYENGMFRAFQACQGALKPTGRLVIVFANKQPDAWASLVSAVIRAGFIVDASWPIQTEMGTRTRARGSAALSSSVWLVCKRRTDEARPGWDNRVLDEMRGRIHERLKDYWDAGIRGPDFVWAGTGPALESYSRHPVVKKANEPGKTMDVDEFLRAVRRLVVEFVVGRVLSKGTETEPVSGLDDVTTYYLLHRHDFRLDDAPIGPCILYAVSCGLSDAALADHHEILVRTGGKDKDEEDEVEAAEGAEVEEGSGSTVCLRPWNQRKRKSLGLDAEGRPAPLIDQIHRLMQLWKGGDVQKVDAYLEERTLRKNALFAKVLQALIELAQEGSEERAILESLSNHVVARGAAPDRTRDMFETKQREDAEAE